MEGDSRRCDAGLCQSGRGGAGVFEGVPHEGDSWVLAASDPGGGEDASVWVSGQGSEGDARVVACSGEAGEEGGGEAFFDDSQVDLEVGGGVADVGFEACGAAQGGGPGA